MNIGRRNLFSCFAGLIATAGISLGQEARRNRVLRVAHLKDVHVYNERRAAEGMAACLRHL